MAGSTGRRNGHLRSPDFRVFRVVLMLFPYGFSLEKFDLKVYRALFSLVSFITLSTCVIFTNQMSVCIVIKFCNQYNYPLNRPASTVITWISTPLVPAVNNKPLSAYARLQNVCVVHTVYTLSRECGVRLGQ